MSFPTSGFPSLADADAWIDLGREPRRECELMISLPLDLREVARKGFWLEMTGPDAALIGWIRFELALCLKNRFVLAAAELRPADGPEPPPEDVWLRISARRA